MANRFFIIDDPRRSLPIRAMLKESMTRWSKPKHAARHIKPKLDLDGRKFHKFEQLSSVANRYGVTAQEISEFCFINGVHTRKKIKTEEVDITELNELMQRAGFDPDDKTPETRSAQQLYFRKKINIR